MKTFALFRTAFSLLLSIGLSSCSQDHIGQLEETKQRMPEVFAPKAPMTIPTGYYGVVPTTGAGTFGLPAGTTLSNPDGHRIEFSLPKGITYGKLEATGEWVSVSSFGFQCSSECGTGCNPLYIPSRDEWGCTAATCSPPKPCTGASTPDQADFFDEDAGYIDLSSPLAFGLMKATEVRLRTPKNILQHPQVIQALQEFKAGQGIAKAEGNQKSALNKKLVPVKAFGIQLYIKVTDREFDMINATHFSNKLSEQAVLLKSYGYKCKCKEGTGCTLVQSEDVVMCDRGTQCRTCELSNPPGEAD
jgi:hypothetical protein